MNPLPALAALAFGGLLLAGCNPNKDQADPMTEEDPATAPAAPADMPPPPDTTGQVPGSETMPPDQPPVPEQDPPPPPNG